MKHASCGPSSASGSPVALHQGETMYLKSFAAAQGNRSFDMDIEDKGPVNHGEECDDENKAAELHEVPRDNVVAMLDALESKLSQLLVTHMQEIKTLRESTARDDKLGMKEHLMHSPSLASTFTAGKFGNDCMDDRDRAISRMNMHIEHLDEFFDGYVQNVRRLQGRLKGGQERSDTKRSAGEIHEYKSIRKQFEAQLLISTFSAGLIVAFCTLVISLLTEGVHSHPLFNVGLLLSFFAISCHIFNMSISGRAASLSSDRAFLQNHDIDYFRSALWTCEHLYMCGIYLFSATLLMMCYGVFQNAIYPAIYCSAVGLGLVALFATKLRDLLVLYRTMIRIQRLVKAFGRRVSGKI